MILVIRGDVFRQQQPAYIAISNPTLVRLARLLFCTAGAAVTPAVVAAFWDGGNNYIGNQLEYLAWLAFEESREDLIVGLAYWAQLVDSFQEWPHVMGIP